MLLLQRYILHIVVTATSIYLHWFIHVYVCINKYAIKNNQEKYTYMG